jgi:hypothetical protein
VDSRIANLANTADAPRVTWPSSHRHIMRPLGGWLGPAEEGTQRVTHRDVEELLLEALTRGPASVWDLARAVNRSFSTVSYRLKQLRRERRVRSLGEYRWAIEAADSERAGQ